MRFLITFLRFWYDFVVGDDWRLAAGAIVAIAVTYAVAHTGLNWWWILPSAIAALLGASVAMAARAPSRAGAQIEPGPPLDGV